MQLIRAQAACINGGYLYEPYIVDQVLDDDGNVLSHHDATPVRQVISEETSAIIREALEYVVSSGSGKNGQVAGYRIGGKTGTADKTGSKTDDNPKGDVVVSFMCFAPADDPQYIMLLTMDTPRRDTGTAVYGGTMVAPAASQIMAEVLPALGIEPDYTAEELAGADAAVPYVVGKSAADAKAALTAAGFGCTLVGDGRYRDGSDPGRRCHRAQQRLHHPVPGGGKAGHPLHRSQPCGADAVGGQQSAGERGTDYEGGRRRQYRRQHRQRYRHFSERGAGRPAGGRQRGDGALRRDYHGLTGGLPHFLHGFQQIFRFTFPQKRYNRVWRADALRTARTYGNNTPNTEELTMKLRELLAGIPVLDAAADSETEITGVSYDSRTHKARRPVRGHDGLCHRRSPIYRQGAGKRRGGGAVPAGAGERTALTCRTEDSRRALAVVGANWFGHPAEEMTMLAVTGTNGKTTTTYLLKAILEQALGAKVGLIGTNQNMIGQEVIPTERTTPESFEVQQLFRQMADAGCTHVVMEVSSHALALDRVYGVRYPGGNLHEPDPGSSGLPQDHGSLLRCQSHPVPELRHRRGER